MIIQTIQFEIAFKMIALFRTNLFDEGDKNTIVVFGLICFLFNNFLDVSLSLRGGDAREINFSGSFFRV